jgi:GNAT superfamily N-acetyltransferase
MEDRAKIESTITKLKTSEIKQYLLIDKWPYCYYALDLRKVKLAPNDPIVLACKHVEDSTWQAQENFFDYLQKRDYLIFITYKNEVIAFAVGATWEEQIYGIFTVDEVMVKPEFQGKKLSKKLSLLLMYLLTRYYAKKDGIKYLIGFGTSCNPKTMIMFYNYRYLLLETNYNPKKTLKKIAWHYVRRYGYTPLLDDNPFFLKNMYPGSHKKLEPINKEHIILKYAPPDFDYIKRGDCMLLSGRQYVKMGYFITYIGFILYLGIEGIRHKNPGWTHWES